VAPEPQRRRAHGDAGLTFAEILVSLVILGVCVTVLLGGTTSLPVAATIHRRDAQADTILRNWAEAIKARGFVASDRLCDTDTYAIEELKTESYLPTDFIYPGFTTSVPAVDSWDGTVFAPCGSGTPLLVRIHLTVTSVDAVRPITHSLEVAVAPT
jgi:hypothetical protein